MKMEMGRKAGRAVLCLLVMFLGARSAGQVSYAACSLPTVSSVDSHSWLVMPDHGSRPGRGLAVLVHLPPRTGALPALTGAAQLARTLNDRPLALAARGRECVIAFAAQGPDDMPVIRVQGVRAVQQGFGWGYDPAGRFDPYPVLRHDGGVRSMTATNDVIAITTTSKTLGDQAFALMQESWHALEVPVLDPEQQLHVWSTTQGLVLGIINGRAITIYPVTVEDGVPVIGPSTTVGTAPLDGHFWSIDSGVYAIEMNDTHAGIGELDARGVQSLFRWELPAQAGVAPIFAFGPRVATVWWERAEVEGRPAAMATLHVREVSLGTGALLYEGPLPRRDVLSRDEFRLLTLIVSSVVIGVLIVVLKSDLDDDAIELPPGVSLAEPARRFVGSVIDGAVAAAVVAAMYGVGFRDLISLEVLIMPGNMWTAIPATFVAGGVFGTLSEWLTGRTIGKACTGSRVIRAQKGQVKTRSIGLRRAFIRNAIKWLMPPVAALALVDRHARHRGDQIAKVAVVVKKKPEGPDSIG